MTTAGEALRTVELALKELGTAYSVVAEARRKIENAAVHLDLLRVALRKAVAAEDAGTETIPV